MCPCAYYVLSNRKKENLGTIQLNIFSLCVFNSVITVAQNLSRVFGGTARIVLQKCLWISVILVQTAFMKQIFTRKITNQNLFIGQRHSQTETTVCPRAPVIIILTQTTFQQTDDMEENITYQSSSTHSNGIIVNYVQFGKILCFP